MSCTGDKLSYRAAMGLDVFGRYHLHLQLLGQRPGGAQKAGASSSSPTGDAYDRRGVRCARCNGLERILDYSQLGPSADDPSLLGQVGQKSLGAFGGVPPRRAILYGLGRDDGRWVAVVGVPGQKLHDDPIQIGRHLVPMSGWRRRFVFQMIFERGCGVRADPVGHGDQEGFHTGETVVEADPQRVQVASMIRRGEGQDLFPQPPHHDLRGHVVGGAAWPVRRPEGGQAEVDHRQGGMPSSLTKEQILGLDIQVQKLVATKIFQGP